MNDKCTKCGKNLNPKTTIWLELSNITGLYYLSLKSDPMPEDESQGAFPFGKDCAINSMNVYKSNNHEVDFDPATMTRATAADIFRIGKELNIHLVLND